MGVSLLGSKADCIQLGNNLGAWDVVLKTSKGENQRERRQKQKQNGPTRWWDSGRRCQRDSEKEEREGNMEQCLCICHKLDHWIRNPAEWSPKLEILIHMPTRMSLKNVAKRRNEKRLHCNSAHMKGQNRKITRLETSLCFFRPGLDRGPQGGRRRTAIRYRISFWADKMCIGTDQGVGLLLLLTCKFQILNFWQKTFNIFE